MRQEFHGNLSNGKMSIIEGIIVLLRLTTSKKKKIENLFIKQRYVQYLTCNKKFFNKRRRKLKLAPVRWDKKI